MKDMGYRSCCLLYDTPYPSLQGHVYIYIYTIQQGYDTPVILHYKCNIYLHLY